MRPSLPPRWRRRTWRKPTRPTCTGSSGNVIDLCLLIINQEDYDNLMKSLRENDPSWPSLMLKLCRALKTSDKLLSSANTNAEQLLQKVETLERVLERGDLVVGAIVETLEDHRPSKSKPPSK
ncbi:uncharacterized protein LOC100829518 isoform X2 [Brachypodium distachyon]|uniref:uncharacterized protein LOC100829518 isoform X2 n=1 Tax=Brachypodium distachyon TaxID=15368 RepID=UPI0001C7472C|nr:uncharacterized protein LOC100829518 isoform X2 [Brachypodium distachyon]|eukprot:XP_024317861.1 uncharacterized protein LOC100829518 isoform X2 [Brachypodium distachyon]